MCGIAGIVSLNRSPVSRLAKRLAVMSGLIAHRGPDGKGEWMSADHGIGLAHRRLAIIDPHPASAQPMCGADGTVVTFNGEIYNHPELREQLAAHWPFRTRSDTETILAAHQRFGADCVQHLRGMFAFALWDGERLTCAVDRFGIKPLYWTVADGLFLFASEIKALLPFVAEIATDHDALAEYLTFQYTLGSRTLFAGVHKLAPGHMLVVEDGGVRERSYWDVDYRVDFDRSPSYFVRHLRELLDESVGLHLRSDVPVGAYLSGGIDSSLVALMAARRQQGVTHAFHGKFTGHPGYDESAFAQVAADHGGLELHQLDMGADDFARHIRDVIYHLDHPVAGPGSFPQFMTSRLAAGHVKVALGGQGGDEVFGGYARYLLAYFEQCIAAAIDGTYRNGNFVVTPESIIPNLTSLREYKPLIAKFWQSGLFGPLDERYFRLIDRSVDMDDSVRWEELDGKAVFGRFQAIFNSERNVRKTAYFDSMTHFDFKCLLPALLHVEDRMSMAHGLESRVPLLDHRVIEFAATIPADVKFKDGRMKHLLKTAFADVLPTRLLERRDKMGFPVPLKEWLTGPLRPMVHDIFASPNARHRPLIRTDKVLDGLDKASRFSRGTWAALSLEVWYQTFHDRAPHYRGLMEE